MGDEERGDPPGQYSKRQGGTIHDIHIRAAAVWQVRAAAVWQNRVAWAYAGGSNGSGFLISEDTVMTAAHVVYNRNAERWANISHIEFQTYNGSTRIRCGFAFLAAPQTFIDQGGAEWDYGFIKLDCTAGAFVGHMGWVVDGADGTEVTVSGYPTDGIKSNGKVLYRSGSLIANASTRTVEHQADTVGGQSGGPIYQLSRGGSACMLYCVHAVHSRAREEGVEFNVGVRITEQRHEQMQRIIGMPRVAPPWPSTLLNSVD